MNEEEKPWSLSHILTRDRKTGTVTVGRCLIAWSGFTFWGGGQTSPNLIRRTSHPSVPSSRPRGRKETPSEIRLPRLGFWEDHRLLSAWPVGMCGRPQGPRSSPCSLVTQTFIFRCCATGPRGSAQGFMFRVLMLLFAFLLLSCQYLTVSVTVNCGSSNFAPLFQDFLGLFWVSCVILILGSAFQFVQRDS